MSHSVVIGGAGFVGSWVVEEILKSADSRVTIIDNLISSERWNVSTDPRVTFIEGSAADFETFEKIQGPIECIYQLACFHGNQSSIVQPLDDLENGMKTTLVTLEWARRNSPESRIVYSGAGCAVAEKTWASPEPVKEIEQTSLFQDSPYAISKITGEMYCLFYVRQYQMDIVRVRFQNVFGPREILGAGVWRGTENTVWRNVIPTFVYRCLTGLDINIFGNSRASRDFTFVSDVARAVHLVAKNGIKGDVYNIASENEVFIDELLSLILEKTNSQSKVNYRGKREWDNSGRRVGDGTKIKSTLGYVAQISIDEGLNETIEWTRNNILKIEKCIAKFNDRLS